MKVIWYRIILLCRSCRKLFMQSYRPSGGTSTLAAVSQPLSCREIARMRSVVAGSSIAGLMGATSLAALFSSIPLSPVGCCPRSLSNPFYVPPPLTHTQTAALDDIRHSSWFMAKLLLGLKMTKAPKVLSEDEGWGIWSRKQLQHPDAFREFLLKAGVNGMRSANTDV